MRRFLGQVLVNLAKIAFNALYVIFCLLPRRDEALFVSRQANEPSDDYLAIGREWKGRGYAAVYLTKKLSARTLVSYAAHSVKEVYHLARCTVCFLDRYDPIVSLINFSCESVSAVPEDVHSDYPLVPRVVQLWHAFGAFKKFGYQSTGTQEGHSVEVLKKFRIHRNYSWIVCTGQQNREAYAAAFAYPSDRILVMGRPEYNQLVAMKEALADCRDGSDSHKTKFLFAPTLRKNSASAHPFRDLYRDADSIFPCLDIEMKWAFHPLEEGVDAMVSVSSSLVWADVVVTDYSSIVYEAYLLGKKVLFYTPDIDEYRNSPGLNTDPQLISPEITFIDDKSLRECLNSLVSDMSAYPQESFENFIGHTFDCCSPNEAKKITDYILRNVRG